MASFQRNIGVSNQLITCKPGFLRFARRCRTGFSHGFGHHYAQTTENSVGRKEETAAAKEEITAAKEEVTAAKGNIKDLEERMDGVVASWL